MHILLVCSLVSLLVPFETEASRHYRLARTVQNAIFDKAFTDEGLVFEGVKTFSMIDEGFALSRAGLDDTIPFKAAGIDSAKVTGALNKATIMTHLIASGIPWMTVFAIMDHAKHQGVDLSKRPGASGAPYALQCGLKAAGQEFTIKRLRTVLKQAHVLGEAGIVQASAFEAAGIDLMRIPVSKEKYEKYESKERRR